VAGIVLVTGAAGAVGTRLVPALKEAGWRVRALVHRSAVPGADEQVAGGLEDDDALARASAGADAVLHLAARTHARRTRQYRELNVAGTERLLRAAAEAGVRRFVHVSSRAAAAGGGGYSQTKLEAEEAVERSPLEHVIVRLPEVVGAGSKEGVDDMLARAARGAPIPVVGRGEDVLCPVHVDDAVVVLVRALSAPAGRTYTIAGDCVSARKLAEECVRVVGSSSRIVPVPVPVVAAGGALARVLPLPLYPDQLARLRCAKPAPSPEAGPELGFDPRPLEAALREAVAAA
jgi:nucleoside-diphosphate-sugar epimerase